MRKTDSFAALTFAEDRTEDVHQLLGFGAESFLFGTSFWTILCVDQTQPKTALFRFLSSDFDAHPKVLFAQRLIGLDVVRGHGTRGTDDLFGVLDISNRPFQKFDESAHIPRERERPFFEVVRSVFPAF